MERRTNGPASFCLPQPSHYLVAPRHCRISACIADSDQGLPVRAERQTADGLLVLKRRADGLARRRLPKASRLVVTPRQNRSTVRAKCHGLHGSFMFKRATDGL